MHLHVSHGSPNSRRAAHEFRSSPFAGRRSGLEGTRSVAQGHGLPPVRAAGETLTETNIRMLVRWF